MAGMWCPSNGHLVEWSVSVMSGIYQHHSLSCRNVQGALIQGQLIIWAKDWRENLNTWGWISPPSLELSQFRGLVFEQHHAMQALSRGMDTVPGTTRLAALHVTLMPVLWPSFDMSHLFLVGAEQLFRSAWNFLPAGLCLTPRITCVSCGTWNLSLSSVAVL